MAKQKFGRWIIIIAALFIIAYALVAFNTPDYPDIVTPKPDFGTAASSVRIVEFSDLQCPACGSAHPLITQLLDEDGDRARFKYYHFPLCSIHPNAQKAAEAAKCAKDEVHMP